MRQAIVILIAVGCTGCVTHYWQKNLVAMAQEEAPSASALARRAVWVLEEENLDNEPSLYTGSIPEGAASDVSYVLPQSVLLTAVGQLASRTAGQSGAITQEQLAYLISMQPESLPVPLARQSTEKVGATARYGLGVMALVAAGEAQKSSDLQQVVQWALRDTLKPDAPANNTLFVYMHRKSVKAEFGYKWAYSAQVVLVSDSQSLKAGRTTQRWMYLSAPQQPPADMVVWQQLPGFTPDIPLWLNQFFDFAMLVRSAGHELAYAAAN